MPRVKRVVKVTAYYEIEADTERHMAVILDHLMPSAVLRDGARFAYDGKARILSSCCEPRVMQRKPKGSLGCDE